MDGSQDVQRLLSRVESALMVLEMFLGYMRLTVALPRRHRVPLAIAARVFIMHESLYILFMSTA
jgi:hypothetical protein